MINHEAEGNCLQIVILVYKRSIIIFLRMLAIHYESNQNINAIYEVCPENKCTDFPMYDFGTKHLVDVYRRVYNDLGVMYMPLQTGSVESVVSYSCLSTVVFYNLCNASDSAVVLFTKNFYLQDSQLITPSTKMSWNDLKNGFS
jgi:hypothetical protein